VAGRSSDGGLSPGARVQIEALAAAKARRTPVENKLSSTLLLAAERKAGTAPAAAASLRPSIRQLPGDRVRVQVDAPVTRDLLRRVRSLHGIVRRQEPRAGVVTAELPVSSLLPLAALPQVRHVSEPLSARRTDEPARVVEALRSSPRAAAAQPVDSEGDVTHGARDARTRLHVSGVGVTVGVVADGVEGLDTLVKAGELPRDVEVLPGAAGQGDQGTDML
jgi:hypothetical protein